MRIVDGIDKFLLEHEGMEYERLKEGLRTLITGREPKSKQTLVDCIRKYAAEKKESTKQTYLRAAIMVERFDSKATFTSVDKAWLDRFVRCMGDGASVNYKALILQKVRSVFNWGLDNGLTSNYPFRRYKIKTEKTPIDNISVEQLRAIRDCQLDEHKAVYRDFFMLTFYLCGINPADLLTLKDENLQNGRIRYRRKKTGKPYDIPVPPLLPPLVCRTKANRHEGGY